MTLEKLLGMTADELDQISEAQLEEICKPFFNVTRPSAEGVITKKSVVKGKAPTAEEIKKMREIEQNKMKANQILAATGLKIRLK
jgi:hypothetical protein